MPRSNLHYFIDPWSKEDLQAKINPPQHLKKVATETYSLGDWHKRR